LEEVKSEEDPKQRQMDQNEVICGLGLLDVDSDDQENDIFTTEKYTNSWEAKSKL